jgi:hypothetical protein
MLAPRLNRPAQACIYRTARDAIRKAFSCKVEFALAFHGTRDMLPAPIESPWLLPRITVKG